MGATRVETRLDAAMGEQVTNIVRFAPCQSVPYGGVLFLLPFLLANGLLSYSLYYSQRERGYYNSNIFFIKQPSYSPETNCVEHIWDDIREKELLNKCFKNIKEAIDAVCSGLNRLNDNPDYLKSLTNFSHLNIAC